MFREHEELLLPRLVLQFNVWPDEAMLTPKFCVGRLVPEEGSSSRGLLPACEGPKIRGESLASVRGKVREDAGAGTN